MKPYIEKLKTYLAQNPPDYSGAESILSLLYQTYTAYNPIDNQKIKDSFANLRNHFPELNLKQFDPIFTTVSDLCLECEQLAFTEGLRLGVTLMLELSEK